MRLLLCGVILLSVASLSPASKADTFEFTFVSLDGLIAGTGTFGTLPLDIDPSGEVVPVFSGYFVTSLEGEVNGIPMVLLPGSSVRNGTNVQLPLNVPLIPYEQFDPYLAFTLDGGEAVIFDSQGGPFVGLTIGQTLGFSGDEIAMHVIDVTNTPEPSCLSLLGLGLIGLVVLSRRKITVSG